MEEWVKTVRFAETPIEIFKNPSPRELRDIEKAFKHKSRYDKYDKMIRWAANSKTKEVYAWKGLLNHDMALNRVKALRYDMSSFESPNWLTGAILDGKYESDKLMTTGLLDRFLKKDWSFAYKYLPGLKKYLDDFRGMRKKK